MGQTGSIVLSDEMLQYKRDQKRTVRYRYEKSRFGYRAVVVGPFHSALYGVIGFGTTRQRAKVALKRNLSVRYNYHGIVLYSIHDEADSVGIIDPRLVNPMAVVRPISDYEACGSAGR